MTERLEFWDNLKDYPSVISSLYHIHCGDFLRKKISSQPDVKIAADFGCGPGYWLEILGAKSQTGFALDFSTNMLQQAETRAPSNVHLSHQNLRDFRLPEPVDLGLCFNALMPESHSDAIRIIENIGRSIAPGGKLVFVVLAFDALIYTANMIHFSMSKQGLEAESLRQRMDTWSGWYSNPLGYVRNENDTVVKYWLREEFEALMQMLGVFQVQEYFKLSGVKNTTAETVPADLPQPWYHGWVLQKAGQL